MDNIAAPECHVCYGIRCRIAAVSARNRGRKCDCRNADHHLRVCSRSEKAPNAVARVMTILSVSRRDLAARNSRGNCEKPKNASARDTRMWKKGFPALPWRGYWYNAKPLTIVPLHFAAANAAELLHRVSTRRHCTAVTYPRVARKL